MFALNVILLVIFIYLGGATLYYFGFTFASLFPYRAKLRNTTKNQKIAVLIPGYKEDAVIIDVARDALEQSYPRDRFEVIVIADSFKPDTLASLRELPIKVVEVSFEKSTKAKALNRAMAEIGDDYDVAMVLDADNVMEHACLERVNQVLDDKHYAVQCHRVAKNLNTNFAILDAISEEIANNTFRKGQRVLGLSSGLAGSGMAFNYAYFKEIMKDIDAVGGFDKELELKIMGDFHSIEFMPDVLVYDEKVQKAEVFYNQRRRWISSQSRNFTKYAGPAIVKLLTRGNINYFNKVFQWIFPPRTIYIATLTLFASAVMIFHPNPMFKWAGGIMLFMGVMSFIQGIPRSLLTGDTLKAIMALPKALFLMFKALFRLKGSNEKFIHTEHTAISVEKTSKVPGTRKAS